VALAVERDLNDLRAGIERWLGRAPVSLRRPAPGYSCETIIVDRELVLRLPPAGEGIFPGYDLEGQAAVQDAAGAAGVPVAGPCRVELEPSFVGVPFVAMPFVDGPIPADFTPSDRWLLGLVSDGERRAVWDGFIDVLVAIHRTPTDGLEGLRTGLTDEVSTWESYADWATDGAPPGQLVDALAWCRANQPVDEPAAGLLWGDVRFGNVIFDDRTLALKAVLDWDMTSIGPFELDLAWFLALDALQARFAAPPAGFGTRDDAIARIEALLGRPLRDLAWYEVFALARASAIGTRISVLQQRAGQRPMFAVGRDPTIIAALERIEASA